MTSTAEIRAFLNPSRIAVIGASNSREKVGGIVFERLIESRRRLFPVNPKESCIQGHKVYPSISALPGGIDLAVITIAAESAVEAVTACSSKEIKNYIIVAGGFSETGPEGKALETKLKELARTRRLNILGPNSLGIFFPDENIDTIFVEHGDKALDRGGSIACIVQSGSIGVEALGYASNTGYGMRAFVGLGNKCGLDELDFLDYFAQDRKTRCLGFYLENIEKGREFLAAAGKVSRKKPVVMLKAGRSDRAAMAVTSHTGKLAGSDKVISGAFKQFGIQRVYDDEAFCDATKVLSMIPDTPGNRVAVLTAAGGYGVMCTDYIEKKDTRAPLKMAVLGEHTRQRIREAAFPFAACENPVDITAGADDRMFSEGLDALLADDGVDMVICIAFFSPPGITESLIDIIAEKKKISAKPIIVFTKYGPFTDFTIKHLFQAGIVAYPSVRRAVMAARILVERKAVMAQSVSDGGCGEKVRTSGPASNQQSDVISGWTKGLLNPGCPDAFEADSLVRLYGIDVPAGIRLMPGQKPDIQSLRYPCALKVCAPEIFHKTDVGGVLLDCYEDDVQRRLETLRSQFPDTPILAAEQLPFMGPELIIGVIRDPQLGHAVMVGAGGILTEVYQDAVFRLVPCSPEEALHMIDELVLARVFDHFRGMDLDKGALSETIARVSRLACDIGDNLSQLDINPIVFSREKWVALDVKIILEPT